MLIVELSNLSSAGMHMQNYKLQYQYLKSV